LIFEAVIVIADFDNMAMMGQLTERCRRHFFIIKDIKPFNKTQITCVRIDMERQTKPDKRPSDKRQRPSEIALLDSEIALLDFEIFTTSRPMPFPRYVSTFQVCLYHTINIATSRQDTVRHNSLSLFH